MAVVQVLMRVEIAVVYWRYAFNWPYMDEYAIVRTALRGKPLVKTGGYCGLMNSMLAAALLRLKVESIGQKATYIHCPCLKGMFPGVAT
jgi:hypothetical protein